jgi:hypothetical protein
MRLEHAEGTGTCRGIKYPAIVQRLAALLVHPVPAPGGTACASRRRRRGAARGVLTPYTAGAALSAGSVLAALASAFNLTVHTVNLGEHVFGPSLHF